MAAEFTIDGIPQSTDQCALQGAFLYKLVNIDGKVLFLSQEDDIDVPVLEHDIVAIHGGEKFLTGDQGVVEDNPPVRKERRPEFNSARNIVLTHAKITGKALKENDPEFPAGRLFLDCETTVDLEITDDMTIVVQNRDSYFVIPQGSESESDIVDIEECSLHGRPPPKQEKYRIRVDKKKFDVRFRVLEGTEILKLVEKTYNEWSLNQKHHNGKRIKIGPEDKVDLALPGIERFETVRNVAQQGSVAT